MERISLFVRTTKTKGEIKLRFRLTDGREVDMYHKSDIQADIADLKKFNADGTVKPRTSIYNVKLERAISNEISLMKQAYRLMKEKCLTANSETFERMIDNIQHPERANERNKTMLQDFDSYLNEIYKDGIIGDGRLKHYLVTRNELQRFLIIKGLTDIKAEDFSVENVMDYRHFLLNEHTYVRKWRGLYANMNEANIPVQSRKQSTVGYKLKMIQAFFTSLEDKDLIVKSPFRKLGRKKKAAVLKEEYDEPVCLMWEEIERIMETDVPESLKETKDAFLLQCALGCRISDFKALSMANLAVRDGIPYVRYLAKKTLRESKQDIETPVVRYALDIILRYNFRLKVLSYVCGDRGYNDKIKLLLELCGIDRECTVFDESIKDNIHTPLYRLASSKLARKTHVDLTAKVQIDLYAAGLHKRGSSAVNRYTCQGLRDRFVLLSAAFHQPLYQVNERFEIV